MNQFEYNFQTFLVIVGIKEDDSATTNPAIAGGYYAFSNN